jgi:hypothetical protein
MRQNFNDEPRLICSTSPWARIASMKASLRPSLCERLAATFSGEPLGPPMRSGASAPSTRSRRNAPYSVPPCQAMPVTGAWITPHVATPSST